jgi:hypothetical protein
MDNHRFNVGQTARLLQSLLNRSKSIRCEILQIMPFDGMCFQYRVRGEDERFDRIAREHELAEMMPLQAETAPLDDPIAWDIPPRRQDRPTKGKG